MATKHKTTRSKRLRKKLFMDEFTVYGFEVSAQMKSLGLDDFEKFVDDFIDMIEAQDLIVGGSGDENDGFNGVVAAAKRYGSATEENRKSVQEWLLNRAECKNVLVGELVDLNEIF